MRPTTCRACGARIIHGTTPNGKRIPLDPQPRPRHDTYANIAVYQHDTGRYNARVLAAGETPERYEKRAVVHYTTCPKRTNAPPQHDNLTTTR